MWGDPLKLKASVDELKQFLPEQIAQLIAGLRHAGEGMLDEYKVSVTITFEKK